MALIPCPACGKQVSEQACTCPQCGHPIAAPLLVAGPWGFAVEADGRLALVVVRYALAGVVLRCSVATVAFGLVGLGIVLRPQPNGPDHDAIEVGFWAFEAICLALALVGGYAAFRSLGVDDRLILSRDGIDGPLVGGRLVPWHEVAGVRYARRALREVIVIERKDGIATKLSDNLGGKYRPSLLAVFAIISNRLETGQFSLPESVAKPWGELGWGLLAVAAMAVVCYLASKQLVTPGGVVFGILGLLLAAALWGKFRNGGS
jgi:hypothetical protein